MPYARMPHTLLWHLLHLPFETLPVHSFLPSLLGRWCTSLRMSFGSFSIMHFTVLNLVLSRSFSELRSFMRPMSTLILDTVV